MKSPTAMRGEMPPEIQIHVREDVDLKGALVVVGAPGLGFVGSITTRYLVEQLKMKRIGGFHSSEFPPYAPVEKGRPLHPVRLHHLQTSCGLDLDCESVVVITSELFPGPQMVYPLADAILDWSRSIDAELLVVPDGVLPNADESKGGKPPEPSGVVRGIGTTDRSFEVLGRADVEPLGEGVMMGLTAGLVSQAEHRGTDVIGLLAESQPDHPDARAAARLVEVLDVMLPGIKLESEPLMKRAEEIEKSVQAIRAQLAQQAAQGGQQPPGGVEPVSMFH